MFGGVCARSRALCVLLIFLHCSVLVVGAGAADGACPSGSEADGAGTCRALQPAVLDLDPYGLEEYVLKHPVNISAGQRFLNGLARLCAPAHVVAVAARPADAVLSCKRPGSVSPAIAVQGQEAHRC
jgi:hypothetical protein